MKFAKIPAPKTMTRHDEPAHREPVAQEPLARVRPLAAGLELEPGLDRRVRQIPPAAGPVPSIVAHLGDDGLAER